MLLMQNQPGFLLRLRTWKSSANKLCRRKILIACAGHDCRGMCAKSEPGGLWQRIRHPGFTTPAEFAPSRGIVDGILAPTKTISSLKQVLASAATKAELNPQPLPPKQADGGGVLGMVQDGVWATSTETQEKLGAVSPEPFQLIYDNLMKPGHNAPGNGAPPAPQTR